jgi:hypothetical protein
MPTEMGGGGSLAPTYFFTGRRHGGRIAAGSDFMLDMGGRWGEANFGNFGNLWGSGARRRRVAPP